MKLSDVMSHSGLSGYAVVAMVLFMLVFLLIFIRVFRSSSTLDYDEARRLPLEGEPGATGSDEVQP